MTCIDDNGRLKHTDKQTSPIRQRCVLTVSLRVLTLALDWDGPTDEDRVSNEALKILTT